MGATLFESREVARQPETTTIWLTGRSFVDLVRQGEASTGTVGLSPFLERPTHLTGLECVNRNISKLGFIGL